MCCDVAGPSAAAESRVRRRPRLPISVDEAELARGARWWLARPTLPRARPSGACRRRGVIDSLELQATKSGRKRKDVARGSEATATVAFDLAPHEPLADEACHAAGGRVLRDAQGTRKVSHTHRRSEDACLAVLARVQSELLEDQPREWPELASCRCCPRVHGEARS
jgi:hypothetical protein